MNLEAIIEAAWSVRENAYAPYSKFKVGAAVRSGSGKIYCGCNVENLSYGLTNCAERVAVGNLIVAGETTIDLVVVVADTTEPISPCGACRQVLAEFGDPLVVLVAGGGERLQVRLSEIFPRAKTGILAPSSSGVPRGTQGEGT